MVLLHDSVNRKPVWWKELGIERIIAHLPKESHEATKIMETLFVDPELKKAVQSNIASIIRSGNFFVSEILLRDMLFGNSPNNEGIMLEHYYLLVGNLTVLNQLKKSSLVQHNASKNHCTPVHAAAICPNSQFLRKLLQVFTDVINVEDSLLRRPIHYAALSTAENLSILLDNGADLRDSDRFRTTPLMLACAEGIHYNVEYILEKCRDPSYINCRSEEGYTALHYAILNNHIECIEVLLSDPYTDLWALTKERGDIFHLVAGTGNIVAL